MIGERNFKKAARNLKSSVKIYEISSGELLGKGMYREVSVFKFNPEYVIKFEMNPGSSLFCNVSEYRNWMNAYYTPLQKWLAPIELINETGQILIQKRVHFDGKYPKQVPWEFTDIHKQNFGWINKQFVCCDYPFLRSGYHPKFRTIKNWL